MPAVAILLASDEPTKTDFAISSVLASGAVTRVIVVDESPRAASHIAHVTSVYVLRVHKGIRRSQAMYLAMQASQERVVLFLDGNISLAPGHVRRLVEPVTQGNCVMSVGLLDWGVAFNKIQRALPRISSQRAVKRYVLDQIPTIAWNGSSVEATMNAVAKRMGPVCDVQLWGARGSIRGLGLGPAKTSLEITQAWREMLVALGKQ